jgi:hypothetical protein
MKYNIIKNAVIVGVQLREIAQGEKLSISTFLNRFMNVKVKTTKRFVIQT